MRLRVLGVSEIYPHRGRPQSGSFVVGQCRSVRHECDVSMLSPRFWSPFALEGSWLKFYRGQAPFQVVEGIPTWYPVTPAWNSYFYLVCQTLSMRYAFGWRASRLEFDVVHAHGVIPAGDPALRIATRRRTPLVVTAYGSDLNLYPKFRSLRGLVRRVLERADVLVTVSRALGDLARELGRTGPVEWIPIGYDPSRFFPGTEVRGPVVLYAGRLFHAKGLEELIAAWPAVRARRPHARLRLVGDGPLVDLLRSRASPDVEFAGAKSHAEVAEEMRRASVFCLPSHREGWPASCVEALACGLRVVATRVGGLGELLDGAPGARTFPVGDVPSLVEALVSALDDTTPPDAIRRHPAPYTWDAIGRRYVDLYHRLLAR